MKRDKHSVHLCVYTSAAALQVASAKNFTLQQHVLRHCLAVRAQNLTMGENKDHTTSRMDIFGRTPLRAWTSGSHGHIDSLPKLTTIA